MQDAPGIVAEMHGLVPLPERLIPREWVDVRQHRLDRNEARHEQTHECRRVNDIGDPGRSENVVSKIDHECERDASGLSAPNMTHEIADQHREDEATADEQDRNSEQNRYSQLEGPTRIKRASDREGQ